MEVILKGLQREEQVALVTGVNGGQLKRLFVRMTRGTSLLMKGAGQLTYDIHNNKGDKCPLDTDVSQEQTKITVEEKISEREEQ